MQEHPLMEYLDFTYSTFGAPEVTGRILRVPAREVSVTKDFPNMQHDTIYETCFVILKGVQSSERTVRETEEPGSRRFKPAYTVEDIPFSSDLPPGELYEFDLSGHCYDPPGWWFSWFVIAQDIDIEGGEIRKIFKE